MQYSNHLPVSIITLHISILFYSSTSSIPFHLFPARPCIHISHITISISKLPFLLHSFSPLSILPTTFGIPIFVPFSRFHPKNCFWRMSIQVFDVVKIVTVSRNKIVSVTAAGDRVFVSCKDGNLLVYQLENCICIQFL